MAVIEVWRVFDFEKGRGSAHSLVPKKKLNAKLKLAEKIGSN